MLTIVEKILFILCVLVSGYLAYVGFSRMIKIIDQGQGDLYLDDLPRRVMAGLGAFVTQRPVYKTRLTTSIFHGFIALAFVFYLLVDLFDILGGYFAPLQRFLAFPALGLYRFIADVLSVAALIGMTYFLVRRYFVDSPALKHHDNVKLHPKATSGIRRDSLIVGLFILLHIGFRFIGESFLVAREMTLAGLVDPWQPFASLVANLWGGFGETGQLLGWHVSWWIALGLILAFVPYFPYTKHIHLLMGPLNFMTRPNRRSSGELNPIDFEDESIEQFGVTTLTDLDKTQLLDAFACIMCNRCQDVCPAYTTGKELSPAALEINKRYGIKEHFKILGNGSDDEATDPLVMLDFAISEAAVWACTTCGACSEICPVGNEPFLDIIDIRRGQVLMESRFPGELQQAFRGLERNGNPWQMTNDRLEWTQPLDFKVPTVEENPEFELLYWVGCAGAFDPRAQRVARAMATLLHRAGVNYAILGNMETCSGDTARRAGNEYVFYEMANMNIETLNAANAKTIVTTCPHCLHTLKNEYPQFGGNFEVVHHTQLLNSLIGEGQLRLNGNPAGQTTFHDPCYLGRHNEIYAAPRSALRQTGGTLLEMARHGRNSFCCGAGGAQMWKEEERGTEAVNSNRFREAKSTGAKTLAVSCPFCTAMLADANAKDGETMQVRDVAEIVLDALA